MKSHPEKNKVECCLGQKERAVKTRREGRKIGQWNTVRQREGEDKEGAGGS